MGKPSGFSSAIDHPRLMTMNRQAGPSIVISILIVCFFAVVLSPRAEANELVCFEESRVGSVAIVEPASRSKDMVPPAVGNGDRPSAISAIHPRATAKEKLTRLAFAGFDGATLVDDRSGKPKRDLVELKPGPGQRHYERAGVLVRSGSIPTGPELRDSTPQRSLEERTTAAPEPFGTPRHERRIDEAVLDSDRDIEWVRNSRSKRSRLLPRRRIQPVIRRSP